MRSHSSAYYPPRAGIGRHFARPANHIRRMSAAAGNARRAAISAILNNPNLPPMQWRRLALAILLPPGGVWLRGPAILARAAVWISVAAFAIFIVFLGSSVANLAFTVLLGIHATSVVYFLEPWIAGRHLLFRMVFSICVLMAMMLFLYMPMRGVVERNLFAPVSANGRGIVAGHVRHPDKLKQGDVIAYRIEGRRVGGNLVQEGAGLGPILAVGGDTVEFKEGYFTVNGIHHASLPGMPASGTKSIPSGCWFVWPKLSQANSVHPGAGYSDLLLDLSIVEEEQLLGKAFKHWFLRPQKL